jgi:Wzt C-terminal domain
MLQRRSGSFAAVIEQVSVRDARGQEGRSFVVGEEAQITVRILCVEEMTDPTIGILMRDRLGNDIYGTNTYHQQLKTGHYSAGEELEITFRLALNLGPGEYSLTVAAHSLDVHIHDCFDWIDRLLVFRVLPPVTGQFIGTAFLHPQVACRRVAPQRGAEDWGPVLAQVFGDAFPRELTIANGGKPWLLSGWYTPEETGETAFRWTEKIFSFLLDLRSEAIYLEIGTDRRGMVTEPLEVRAWLFDQPLGMFVVESTVPWAVCSLPLPPSCRVAHGLVRMHVEGWCPAESGVNEDRRVLGVRVRRIWVAERPNGR